MTSEHPLVARYIERLTAALSNLTPADRTEVVKEIADHISDAAAAGKPIDDILKALGSADDLARGYEVELLLHPKKPAASSIDRYVRLIALVALGSIPTFVVVVTLGTVGLSLALSGVTRVERDDAIFELQPAESLVERDGRLGEAPHRDRADLRAVTQFDRGHFVLSAGLQSLVDVPQALAAPEAEQDASFLGADQQDRTVRKVDEMPPFDHLVKRSTPEHGRAHGLDANPLPAAQRRDVGVRVGRRR